MPDRAMRSRQKKYARGMGYPDLQDGGPPRSRAGAEPPDGPVPAETPGEEAPGYRPPPVPGGNEAAWRGADRSADEAAWRGADEAAWRGGDHSADEAAWRGAGEAAWRSNGTTDRAVYPAPGNNGPAPGGGPVPGGGSVPGGSQGSGGGSLAGSGQVPGSGPAPGGSRLAPRTGAHRAVRSGEPGPARPAPADATEARPGAPGSHRLGRGGQHRQSAPAQPAPGSTPWPGAPTQAPAPRDNATQPPSRPVTGPQDRLSSPPAHVPAAPGNGIPPPSRPLTDPQDQSWRPSPPATGPDNGSELPKRAVTGPQDQAWLSSPPPAVPDSGSRLPSRTGPQPSARPTDHRPPATRPGLARRPAGDTRALPPGSAGTGPQTPYQARPDDEGDAPPGLAITREPPGARRPAPQQADSPRDGRRGPNRGFPPRPGQPDPVYPPGQFSSWNRAATRAAWLGATGGAGGATEAEAEPGYSALALSDAAADLTATQTWAVIDDEPPPGPSAARRASRDWGSHAEDVAQGRPRTADGGGATGGGAAGGGARGGQSFGPRRGHGAGRPAPGPGDRGTTGPNAARPGGTGRRAGGLGADAAGLGATGLAAAGFGASAVDAAGPGTAPGSLAGAGRAGTPGPDTDTGVPDGPAGLTGPGGPAGPGGLAAGAGERTEPGGRAAARRAADTARQAPTPFDETRRGRPPRDAATRRVPATDGEPATTRRSGRRGVRRNGMMATLLLAPVLVVVLVVGGYVYLSGRHAPAPHAAPPSHPAAAPNSPAPTLGPWKHIESRSQDPVPLTISELFPAKFTADSQSGTLTVSKEGTKCTHEVIGSKLAAAVRKADCTQVLRASYLSTNHKIMATVGVLNLKDATAAGKAGKAAGAVEFIKQLASKHGPTRNIAKGTGIVAAYVKGHYLILTWTEFANLHAPSGKTKRKQLEGFSTGLVAGTANVSLTNRMVTGHASQPQA